MTKENPAFVEVEFQDFSGKPVYFKLLDTLSESASVFSPNGAEYPRTFEIVAKDWNDLNIPMSGERLNWDPPHSESEWHLKLQLVATGGEEYSTHPPNTIRELLEFISTSMQGRFQVVDVEVKEEDIDNFYGTSEMQWEFQSAGSPSEVDYVQQYDEMLGTYDILASRSVIIKQNANFTGVAGPIYQGSRETTVTTQGRTSNNLSTAATPTSADMSTESDY